MHCKNETKKQPTITLAELFDLSSLCLESWTRLINVYGYGGFLLKRNQHRLILILKMFYLWRSFKSRVHSYLWQVSVADVFIAVPYTVN